MAATIRLLSYGTLQQREVQLANYGRELEGEADVLRGGRGFRAFLVLLARRSRDANGAEK